MKPSELRKHALASFTKREKDEQTVRAVRDEQVDLWLPKLIPALCGAFMLAPEVTRWEHGHSATAYMMNWRAHNTPRVHLIVRVNAGISAWRDLTPVFQALDATGVASVDDWTSNDDAQSYTRIYTTKVAHTDNGPDFDLDVELQITATLPGDTDTCRRVLVGYDEVPPEPARPRYELRCDGEPGVPAPDTGIPSRPDHDLLF